MGLGATGAALGAALGAGGSAGGSAGAAPAEVSKARRVSGISSATSACLRAQGVGICEKSSVLVG